MSHRHEKLSFPNSFSDLKYKGNILKSLMSFLACNFLKRHHFSDHISFVFTIHCIHHINIAFPSEKNRKTKNEVLLPDHVARAPGLSPGSILPTLKYK